MTKLKASLKYFRLSLFFALIVFTIIFFTMFLIFTGAHLLAYFQLVDKAHVNHFPLFAFSLTSIIIGTIIAVFFSRKPLRPFREIMNALDKIADGDYTVRLHLKGPEEFHTMSDKFNHMAKELDSVEMLRKDFINNFSHEFKTPIVSIRGFAKALKWEDLSKEERTEYLDIIISESERLSTLSTNILYLSKLENQTILTDKKMLNVSEQLRLIIVLLDHKITEKNIELLFDSQEYYLLANEEMLRQMWINLLDNALKFSPQGGTIRILIRKTSEQIIFQIANEAAKLPDEVLKHLFDKFYQSDTSHSTPGNGLGLSIVKKIIDLHNGTISVHSTDTCCTFQVTLPVDH